MKQQIQPPRLALAFFRWYCHPKLLEEIEGDLLEQFHKRVGSYGVRKARLLFVKETVLLFRPSIVSNISHLLFKLFINMKKMQWLHLVLLNLLIVLCMFLPFLPGRYDALVLGLSGLAQLTGFFGLLLVPIGILWLIQEIRKIAGRKAPTSNWANGYYFAITTTIICFLFALIIVMGFFISVGLSAAVISAALLTFIFYRSIPAIKNLKNPTKPVFHSAPLYLLSVPVIAFTARLFFMSAATEYSRNYAIEQGHKVIAAIENYRNQKGSYPESLEYVHYVSYVSSPSIMGIPEFRYEKNGAAYNLSFVQWQNVGETEEVVMFNKFDEHNVKGHYASYNAGAPHWKYYWLD